MKMAVADLKGSTLDWAVALSEGYQTGQFEEVENSLCVQMPNGRIKFIRGGSALLWVKYGRWSPTAEWDQGAPLLLKNKVSLVEKDGTWTVSVKDTNQAIFYQETTQYPLQAAMRCVVASHFGHEIEVPSMVIGHKKPELSIVKPRP